MLNKRGNSGKDSPFHQSQTVSFGSFEGLLQLNPKEFQISPESDLEDSARSRLVEHEKESKKSITHHHQPIPSASKAIPSEGSDARETSQSSKQDQETDQIGRTDPIRQKLDKINAKRRKERGEFKAKYPLSYQKKLKEIARKTKIRNQNRKSLGLPTPLRKSGATKTRSNIRKRVREGQGTKEDEEYINRLRIKNQLYRKKKKEEKKLKNHNQGNPSSKEKEALKLV